MNSLKAFYEEALDTPKRSAAIVGMLAIAAILSPAPWIHVPTGIIGFAIGSYVRSKASSR
jgi:hypothetical protein